VRGGVVVPVENRLFGGGRGVQARVLAGIHFRTADTQGAVLGNKVAHYLKKHYFQPVQ